MSPNRSASFIAICAVVISLGACSNYRGPRLPPRKPAFAASGKITVDGKPAEGVEITLMQKDGDSQYSTGVSDAEGHFELQTYKEHDGVPAGEYVVTFVWPLPFDKQDTENDKLHRLYSDPTTSKHSVTITNQPQVLETFDLKVAGQKWKPLPKDELRLLKFDKERQAVMERLTSHTN